MVIVDWLQILAVSTRQVRQVQQVGINNVLLKKLSQTTICY